MMIIKPNFHKELLRYYLSAFLIFSILLGNFYLLEGFLYIGIIKIAFFIAVLFFLLFLYNRYENLSSKAKRVNILYLFYFLYLFLVSLVYYFDDASRIIIESSIYFLKVNMWLCIFFLILYNKLFKVEKVVYLIVIIGILFSLSAIINFFSSDLELFNIPRYQLNLPRIEQSLETVGIFGFYTPGRTAYYFSEAAKFAQFLLGPLFLSIGLYKITKKKKFILFSLLLITAILLTNSLAAFITLLMIIPVIFLFNKGKFAVSFILILLFIVFFFIGGALSFLYVNPEIEGSEYLTKTFTKSSTINVKIVEYLTIMEILRNNWFGIQGVFRVPYSMVYSEYMKHNWVDVGGGFSIGLFDDLARGGIVGLIFRCVILYTLVMLFHKKFNDKHDVMFKYSLFTYFALFIMSTSYGPYDSYQNLFYLALSIYLYEQGFKMSQKEGEKYITTSDSSKSKRKYIFITAKQE